MSMSRERRTRELAHLRHAGWTVAAYGPFRRRPQVRAASAGAVPARSSAEGRRVFLIDCPACCRVAGPFVLGEAERLAGTHDDLIHRGRPTTEIRPDGGPAPERGAA